ncbi:hypothetical protein JZ751_024127 [Albula glossodonta]|uniref:Uncharacterized protein n=1 Tax=Albula glossodonta TaxID=121402 RepID=A0A8T2NRX8_9TELE|nr:hypothetical protein JZ751_024127 [Albula glossodonta]
METIRKKNIPACHAEISKLESELTNLDSLIKMQKESVEMKDASMKEVQDEVNKLEDMLFKDFCAEIGVSNIREYEQEHLKQQQEVDKKRLQFETQKTRLGTQLEYEQAQLEQQGRKLKTLEDTMLKEERKAADQKKAKTLDYLSAFSYHQRSHNEKNKIISLAQDGHHYKRKGEIKEPEEEKLLKAVDETLSKMKDLKNQLLLKKNDVSDSKAEVDKKAKSLQEKSRELVKVQKEVISLETALEQKRMERHNSLFGCKIQGLPISLLSGSLDHISELQLDSESQSTSATLDIFEREAQMQIDYSDLRKESMDLDGEEAVEVELERLREVVSSLEGASSKVTRKCHQEFEQVKAKRYRLFSQCFEHVSIVIDQIYKKLCRNSSAQVS